MYFCSQKSVRNFGFYDARKVGVLPDTLTNPILYDMSIRVKAKQTLMGVGENKMARYGETFLAVIAAWEEEHR